MRRIAAIMVAGLLGVAAPLAEARAQMQMLETPARPGEPEPPCAAGPMTIAELSWPSAGILAHVHAQILEAEYGCTVRVVAGELSGTISSMTTTEQPAIAPELWVSRVPDIWNGALRAGTVRAAGPSFSGGALEGWFVPDYVREEHPGLSGAADLLDHWQVFADPRAEQEQEEEPERARFLSCPQDWACALINRNLLAAHGLDERFEVTTPADRLELDRMLADAVSRREPVVFYYWQPNALIEQLSMVPLDMGRFDPGMATCIALADCVAFSPSAFAPDTVVIGAAAWVFSEAPEIAAYLGRAAMPVGELNRLLAWHAETGAGLEETAAHFLATGEAVWRPWVAP